MRQARQARISGEALLAQGPSSELLPNRSHTIVHYPSSMGAERLVSMCVDRASGSGGCFPLKVRAAGKREVEDTSDGSGKAHVVQPCALIGECARVSFCLIIARVWHRRLLTARELLVSAFVAGENGTACV